MLIIAGENQQTSTINISDSTINIYGMRGEHCTPSQPEPPIEEEWVCANTLYSTGEIFAEGVICPRNWWEGRKGRLNFIKEGRPFKLIL